MIDISYVNNGYMESPITECTQFREYLETCCNDVDSMIDAYNAKLNILALEREILGEIEDPDKLNVVTEGATEIIKKIGDKIIEIFNKFKNLVTSIGNKITGLKLRGESDIKKLDRLIKVRPELKDEIIASYKAGELELKDINSFKELNRTFDEIMKISKSEKVDPHTLKGKWEIAKKKFEEADKSKAVKVAAATTTVLTCIIAMRTYKSKVNSANNTNIKCRQEMQELKEKMYKDLTAKGAIDQNTGLFQTKLAIYRELTGKYEEAIGHNLSVVNRLTNSIARTADRLAGRVTGITGDVGAKYHNNMQEGIRKKKEKEDKDSRDKAKQAARETKAREGAKFQFDKQHEDERNRMAARKATAETNARNAANRKDAEDHRQEDLNNAVRTANAQQAGKNQANRADAKAHAKEDMKSHVKKAKKAEKAKLSKQRKDYRKHQQDYDNRANNTAYTQQRAKNEADYDDIDIKSKIAKATKPNNGNNNGGGKNP